MEKVLSDSLWLLLLIPLVIGGSLVILYLLLQAWSKRAQAEIAPLSADLRVMENQYRRLSMTLQTVSPQDPEPYGLLAKTLQERLEEVGTGLSGLRQRYVSIQERLPRKSQNPLERLIGGPFVLYNLRHEIAALQKQMNEQQVVLANAGQAEQALSRAAGQVAGWARQAKQLHQGSREKLDRLRTNGVRGQTLEAAEQKEQQFQARLANLPGYFFAGSEAQVIAQADKETVIQAHQILTELYPQQAGLLVELQTWDNKLARAQDITGQAGRELTGVEQSLAAMPATLDLTAQQARYDSLNNAYQTLSQNLSHAEIERFDELATEADALVQSSQDLSSQLRHICHQQAALEKALPELAAGLKQITGQYTTLGTSKIHPISWTRTSSALSRLSQQVNALVKSDTVRSLEQVEQDLDSATHLLAQEKELAAYCQGAAGQHAELLSLLDSSEITQGPLWAQSTQKLLGQLREYSLDNWLRADAVGELPEELKHWTVELQRLAGSNPAQSIPEEQLAQSLEDTRRLVQGNQALRVRINAIETRLAALQQTETQALEQLDLARKTLMQVGYILRSNSFLTPLASPEAERLQSQVERLAGELEQRGQGTVEYKARQVSGLSARIEKGMNDWLDRLNQDTQAKENAITASLTRLDSIAPLSDPPLAEGRRLLTSGRPHGIRIYGQKSQFSIKEMVTEFKQRSDYHQSCSAVQRALEDLEKPVVESYHAASQYRQQVIQSLDELSTQQRQKRAWPPTSVSIDAERQELGRIEGQWQALKDPHSGERVKAIDLVARLGDLSAKYQTLDEKLRQAKQQSGLEQAQIQSLERDLDGYTRQWDRQWQTHQDRAVTNEEIRELLTIAENESYRIHTQYREGKLDYAQVLQGLQSLVRRVRLFQATLDDTHVVDINGQVITSRDSKRTPGEW